MRKKDFVEKLSKKTGMPKSVAQKIIDVAFELIKDAVFDDGEVSFMGFGKFKAQTQKERKARNPNTGEQVIIPKRDVVKFKPSQDFKERIEKR